MTAEPVRVFEIVDRHHQNLRCIEAVFLSAGAALDWLERATATGTALSENASRYRVQELRVHA